MKTLLVILTMYIASTAFSQTPQQCKQAFSDLHFRPPAQMSVNQGPGMGAHTVLPLFSENGMDFYGLDRMKSLTGVPISENGAWVVVVFGDESLREAEAQHLMQRLQNPNLKTDYASGLKFVMVSMELKDDHGSERYKEWLKCSSVTSSASRCPYPTQVPMVSDVFYYQPQQCITNDPKAWGGFLLFDDSQYSNSQYNKAHPLSFQSSLLKAANMLLEKFKIED
jgi:hypothetical protein